MTSINIFMKGHWTDLVVSTFEVKKEILEGYLPKDTELDLFQGKALMSMVAFTFYGVSFFGFKVPLHQNFGQINFRFYVKSKINGTKGVVFIKEFAPKPLIASVANIFYNEPYYFKNITYTKFIKDDKITLEYRYKGTKTRAKGDLRTTQLTKNTLEHFVMDRYVAFIKSKKRETLQYKIYHKPWQLYNLEDSYFDQEILNLLPINFKNIKYISTCFVDGSAVEVQKGVLQSV